MAIEPNRPRPRAELDQVGIRDLKNQLSGVLDRTVRQGRTVVVTNHNRPDAVIVPPAEYDALLGERERREQLSETVAMLLAAVAAGVRIPSETLELLDLGASELDWRALNAFQARYPIAIAQGEEGLPLPLSNVPLVHTPAEEDDEELKFV